MNNYKLTKNFLTKDISSIKIGGVIPCFYDVYNKTGLKEVFKIIKENRFTYYVVGGATKILFPDYFFRDALLRISNDYIKLKGEEVIVASGTKLKKLASFMINNGYEGFSGLLSIPGNLSGAIINNAGAFGDEISKYLISVTCFYEGKFIELTRKDMTFSYRKSSFKDTKYIIYEAKFKCVKGDLNIIKNKALENTKSRVNTQPQNVLTLGSTFKNVLERSVARDLDSLYVKGLNLEGISISNKHANFIINMQNASQKNFLNILVILRSLVYNKFKYIPDSEVIILRW